MKSLKNIELSKEDLEILRFVAISGFLTPTKLAEELALELGHELHSRLSRLESLELLTSTPDLKLPKSKRKPETERYSLAEGVSLYEIAQRIEHFRYKGRSTLNSVSKESATEIDALRAELLERTESLQYEVEKASFYAQDIDGDRGAEILIAQFVKEVVPDIYLKIEELCTRLADLEESFTILRFIKSYDVIEMPEFNEDWPAPVQMKWFDTVIAINMAKASRHEH